MLYVFYIMIRLDIMLVFSYISIIIITFTMTFSSVTKSLCGYYSVHYRALVYPGQTAPSPIQKNV